MILIHSWLYTYLYDLICFFNVCYIYILCVLYYTLYYSVCLNLYCELCMMHLYNLTVWLYGALVCLQETPKKLPENRASTTSTKISARWKTTATATFRAFWCSPSFAVCWHRCIPCFAPGPVKKRAGPRHYDGVSSLSHNPTYGIMMYYVVVDQHTNTDNIDNIDYVIVCNCHVVCNCLYD